MKLVGPRFREKCNRILAFIAVRGPVNRNEIEDEIKPAIDHPTIHDAVKELIASKLIKEVRTERRNRGLVVHYFNLTRLGLTWLGITESGMFLHPHAAIAEKHHDLLPEIFDVWPNIVKVAARYGVEDYARENFQQYCGGAFEEERRRTLQGRIDQEGLRRLLDEFFLSPSVDGKWGRALAHDRALADAVTLASRRRIEELSTFFEAEGNQSAAAALKDALQAINS